MEVAMRHDRIYLWIAVLCMFVPLGCSKKVPEKPPDRIDGGQFTGSTYRNRFLGFRLTIPPNWSIQDQQTQQEMMHNGQKMIAGDNENMQAVMRAGEARSVTLLNVLKYALGAPVPFNAAISGTAELVSQFPGIRSGGDYLFHARRLLEAGQVKYSFPREAYRRPINGVVFDVMTAALALSPQMVVKQEYYATIRKGYALVLILSFGTEEDGNELRQALDTMIFNELE
jgi:hypothetical protein